MLVGANIISKVESLSTTDKKKRSWILLLSLVRIEAANPKKRCMRTLEIDQNNLVLLQHLQRMKTRLIVLAQVNF